MVMLMGRNYPIALRFVQGKGLVICTDRKEAEATLKEILGGHSFGAAA